MNGLSNLKRHLIAVDLRGMGKSSLKNPANRYGHWAQDMKEFCQAKKIEKCMAIGESMGGGVAMKFAEIAPEIVVKMLLVSSMPHTSIEFLNGDKQCKTAAEIKEHPEIAPFYEMIVSKNWQAILEIYNQYFFAGLDISK